MSIVVAYMPGPEGDAAVTAAVAEARLRSDRVVVVNGTRGDRPSEEGVSGLDELLADAGVEHEVVRPVGVDVADLVLEELDRVNASMLVVGLRRRTPVGKLVLGSVSQRLLLEARVPVLAVHAAR